MQERDLSATDQLEAVSAETQSIKEELSRLEDRNNQLQGYGLDNMSAEELSGLIHGLTQVQSVLCMPSTACSVCDIKGCSFTRQV